MSDNDGINLGPPPNETLSGDDAETSNDSIESDQPFLCDEMFTNFEPGVDHDFEEYSDAVDIDPFIENIDKYNVESVKAFLPSVLASDGLKLRDGFTGDEINYHIIPIIPKEAEEIVTHIISGAEAEARYEKMYSADKETFKDKESEIRAMHTYNFLLKFISIIQMKEKNEKITYQSLIDNYKLMVNGEVCQDLYAMMNPLLHFDKNPELKREWYHYYTNRASLKKFVSMTQFSGIQVFTDDNNLQIITLRKTAQPFKKEDFERIVSSGNSTDGEENAGRYMRPKKYREADPNFRPTNIELDEDTFNCQKPTTIKPKFARTDDWGAPPIPNSGFGGPPIDPDESRHRGEWVDRAHTGHAVIESESEASSIDSEGEYSDDDENVKRQKRAEQERRRIEKERRRMEREANRKAEQPREFQSTFDASPKKVVRKPSFDDDVDDVIGSVKSSNKCRPSVSKLPVTMLENDGINETRRSYAPRTNDDEKRRKFEEEEREIMRRNNQRRHLEQSTSQDDGGMTEEEKRLLHKQKVISEEESERLRAQLKQDEELARRLAMEEDEQLRRDARVYTTNIPRPVNVPKSQFGSNYSIGMPPESHRNAPTTSYMPKPSPTSMYAPLLKPNMYVPPGERFHAPMPSPYPEYHPVRSNHTVPPNAYPNQTFSTVPSRWSPPESDRGEYAHPYAGLGTTRKLNETAASSYSTRPLPAEEVVRNRILFLLREWRNDGVIVTGTYLEKNYTFARNTPIDLLAFVRNFMTHDVVLQPIETGAGTDFVIHLKE
ncbi:unnamed protein product [Caenorhabditis bovis]|uniref:Uncharacterized protein n=1 Tax=Caenorhabditis bovis TaxID=2654633 RepID=A0A8S1FAA1_9PELO|nr:unnamed protein product [Caenorhabditis bovis]